MEFNHEDHTLAERMPEDCEAHLKRVQDEFTSRLDTKYRRGQIEHGGHLWEKDTLFIVEEAINEAVDQVVYLLTIREQLLSRPHENK